MTVLEDDMMETEDATADTCNTDNSGGAAEDANVDNIEMDNTNSTAATGDAATDIVDDSDNTAAADDGEVAEDDDGEVVEEGEGVTEKVVDEDLEEGECTSDDEPEPAPVTMVKEVKEEMNKHRGTRSRSRDRHKRSKRSKEKRELDEDQKKKRELRRKLKALEENMGLIDDWEEDAETPAASEDSESRSSDSRSRSGSRSSSASPGRRRSRERRKREREKRHARKRRRDREGQVEICQMFMQGKCQKTAKECIFSHDAEPPQVWELCKFYLRDRCAKRDKCLYLHKGFPCKFFHTGRSCGATAESCQFSHEPLNDMTRSLILKHIETAPKDILGEFPRMTRTEAANAIFQTEAKNKGWITKGPNAVKPPDAALEPGPERMEAEEEGAGERLEAPSHIKLNPIQEKLLKASQQEAGLTGSTRWSGQDQEAGPPPLAVQQALAMTGGRSHPGHSHGIQSHGVMRNNGAFAPASASQRRQTVGLLGPAPEAHWSGSPFGAGGYTGKQPPGLMDVKVNEEEVHTYLIKQRIVAAKVHEEFNEPSDDEAGDNDNSGTGGDETPEVTPPNSREGSPFGDQNIPPNLPKAQMKLLQRIQQKQKDRQDTDSNNDQSQEEGGQDEDWYGDEEKREKEDKTELGAPFTLNNLNLPNGLTNMLTAIRASTSPSQGQEKGGIGFQQPAPATPEKKPESRRQDPRRNRNDPRNNRSQRESEEEIERKKDERIMDLDLGSFFGDLELPPLTVSPERTEEEKSFTDALGLPFKPHIIHEVAKEIDASYDSHSPIDWILRPVVCPKPDYADIKHLFSNAQLEADPRLRRFAKSGMAKMKELPLPSFPTPKTDPRLKRKEAASALAQSKPSAPQRRRSSEDGEGGQVYNPAKELSRAKQQQQPPVEAEAYSPGQDYQDQPPPAGDPGQEAYDPYDDQEADYGGPPPPGDFGHPPPSFPPPPGQPPFDPHQGYPPPQGNWAPPPRPPTGRGYPPIGQPDPYYQGQGPPGAPYGAPFGPPRGKFNGPPRGNFNNRGFPPNRERGGGGFGNQRRKDPRKRH